jgi:hypothetical protein
MDSGRPSDAIPHFQVALGADVDGSVHLQLAKAYERTGQIALAKRTREQFEAAARHKIASKKDDDDAEIAPP